MPKRSPDTSSSDVGRSSESDVKPADQHDPSSEDENKTPKKKPRKSPKSPKKDNLDGGDKICGKWTQEEDAILFDVIGDKIWKMIKEDGRLVYRGSPSVKGHWTAIKRSMKIGESSGK